MIQDCLKELEVMTLYEHPNILKATGISLDSDFLVFTQLCKTNLRDFITRQTVEYKTILKLLIDLTSALSYLHNN